MERKLTKEETDKLFQLCKEKHIYHYDIQLELVDHLASEIEEKWKRNPELSFHDAMIGSFGKFGINGFHKIQRLKEEELRKKYNRMLWRYILEFYRWPKFVITFALTLGVFLLFQVIEQTSWVIITFTSVLFIASFVYLFLIVPKFKKIVTRKKSFLLIDQLKQVSFVYVSIFQLPNLSYQIFNLANIESITNRWILFGISFLMVAFSVLLYGHFFYIPKKIKEHFMEQYAEFAN